MRTEGSGEKFLLKTGEGVSWEVGNCLKVVVKCCKNCHFLEVQQVNVRLRRRYVFSGRGEVETFQSRKENNNLQQVYVHIWAIFGDISGINNQFFQPWTFT